METKPVLSDEDSYLEWSVWVKTDLMAEDLWDFVEATNEPPTPENEAAFKAWRKMNAMALRVIQRSLGSDRFSDIREITSARIAWDTLAGKYKLKGPGESDKEGNIDDGVVIDMDLCKSLKKGDWKKAEESLTRHPHAISDKITVRGQTALHVAAEAGHVRIVEELVKQMSEEDLEIKDNEGLTALAQATYHGNYRIAVCMLGKNKNLISIRNNRGSIPVLQALKYGHLNLARYLYQLTPPDILMPGNDNMGAAVVCEAIYNKALDIALDLVKRYPCLAFAEDGYGNSPFYTLARMPDCFPSGSRLVFWKRWIYSGIQIQSVDPINETCLNIQKLAGNQSNDNGTSGSGLSSLSQLVSKLQTLLGIKHLYEMKLTHSLSNELLSCMTAQFSISSTQQMRTGRVREAVVRAAREGIFELVFEMVKTDPLLVFSHNVFSHDAISSNIFSAAVQYRRAKIFSLIYGFNMKHALAGTANSSNGNTLLHMAGMLAPSTSLDHIAGAALQMQRELQWFKEVESIVPPSVHGQLNRNGLTPRQFFTENHKYMMSKGEIWMKDTASSCTVVGALIVTIMFAAIFTVPDGYDQNIGPPNFLNEKLSLVFIVSDALSLFSSSTSVLMFLGILTSRYAEEDFLESLPRKMIIGLYTLFFSIVAMMTTFSAALLLTINWKSWIFKSVIYLASIPITLFVLMQFPLFVAMAISTYGPSIFDRKMKCWF